MNINIGAIDLAVLTAYLLGVVIFGMWLGRRRQDLANYLLGGRDLPWWAVLGSIVATETSTVTFLSVPGISFAEKTGDLRFLQLPLGYLIGRTIVVLVFLPQYFRGEMYSAYEVLKKRFGGATERVASSMFLITRTLSDGLRLYLTAIVLEKIVGLPLPVCVIVLGVGTIVYTFVGGMRSVVWNDCIQFVVYISGAVLAGVIIIQQLPGGYGEIVAFAKQTGRLQVFDWSLNFNDPFTIWAGLIGGVFLALGSHGTDQLMVQRYLCARSQRDAGRALFVSGFIVLAQFALFLLLGVALACFYDRFPPAMPFDRNDEVFATFIIDYIPTGLLGITLAAVFSAAMSTLSSSLSSSSSAALNDLYLPLTKTEKSPAQQVWISRVLTAVFGIAQIGVGIGGAYFAASVIGSIFSVAGFTTGVILGVFFLGTLTKSVGQGAALCGLVAGLAVMSYVAFGTEIAWPWFTIIGSGVTFVVGLLGGRLWWRAEG